MNKLLSQFVLRERIAEKEIRVQATELKLVEIVKDEIIKKQQIKISL